jgi:hypothetical protein
MRNRYYDPATGQFTQPDPIGIAGGLNVYGFAAGDPIGYADPYGLEICARSRLMRQQIETTYNVNIEWDERGCVSDPSKVTPRDGGGYSALQDQLHQIVRSAIRFDVTSVTWGRLGRGSQIRRAGSNRFIIEIARAQYEDAWYFSLFDNKQRIFHTFDSRGRCEGRYATWTVGSLLVHEFGHAAEVVSGRSHMREAPAVEWQNRYHALRQEPLRCLPG